MYHSGADSNALLPAGGAIFLKVVQLGGGAIGSLLGA